MVSRWEKKVDCCFAVTSFDCCWWVLFFPSCAFGGWTSLFTRSRSLAVKLRRHTGDTVFLPTRCFAVSLFSLSLFQAAWDLEESNKQHFTEQEQQQKQFDEAIAAKDKEIKVSLDLSAFPRRGYAQNTQSQVTHTGGHIHIHTRRRCSKTCGSGTTIWPVCAGKSKHSRFAIVRLLPSTSSQNLFLF